jgi:hypothetical protein
VRRGRGGNILVGMAMQDADCFQMYEQWDSLKNACRRILDIIEWEVSHTSIIALKLFWEHPDDPVCLKAVLLQSLQEEWPEDD